MYKEIDNLNEMELLSIEINYKEELKLEENETETAIAPVYFVKIDSERTAMVVDHETNRGVLQKKFTLNDKDFYIYLTKTSA